MSRQFLQQFSDICKMFLSFQSQGSRNFPKPSKDVVNFNRLIHINKYLALLVKEKITKDTNYDKFICKRFSFAKQKNKYGLSINI